MLFTLNLFLLSLIITLPSLIGSSSLQISIFLFFLYLIKFIKDIGVKLPVLRILELFAILTWLLAPALSYYLTEINWYQAYSIMPIPVETYFEVAMPSTLALLAGLSFPNNSVETKELSFIIEKIEIDLSIKKNTWQYLVVIGAISAFLFRLMPPALAQVFYFGRALLFVGIIYYLFSSKSKNYKALIGGILFTLVLSIYAGMFGDFVFWSLFFVLLFQLKKSFSFFLKTFLILFGFIILLLVQSVKADLRQAIWYTEGNSPFLVFSNLVLDKVSSYQELLNPVSLSKSLDRANQGYITAFVIRHTPAIEPFAEGETIFLAILASIVPRALWPDKPRAGGKENIARFAGIQLGPGVSYNIAPLGDAYVNFGPILGAVFLFFYGLFFKFLFTRLLKMAIQKPLIVLWIPLIFLAGIVAETDVATTINHTTKAIVFILITYQISLNLFKIKLL